MHVIILILALVLTSAVNRYKTGVIGIEIGKIKTILLNNKYPQKLVDKKNQ